MEQLNWPHRGFGFVKRCRFTRGRDALGHQRPNLGEQGMDIAKLPLERPHPTISRRIYDHDGPGGLGGIRYRPSGGRSGPCCGRPGSAAGTAFADTAALRVVFLSERGTCSYNRRIVRERRIELELELELKGQAKPSRVLSRL